jgi:DNA-binding response OmpR family regulator
MTADPSVITLIRETDLTQYLVKPFSAGVLKAKLQGLLASVSPKNE